MKNQMRYQIVTAVATALFALTMSLNVIAVAATTPVIKDFNQGCITSNNSSSPTTCKTDGPSGGGGGYGGPNSHAILKYVADELKRHILNASPQIFANLPEGWTQENYAALFDYNNIKKRPNIMKIRPEAGHQPIMFSAETSEEGHAQIVAYQWFFQTYDSYAVISEEDSRLKEEYGVTWDMAKKHPEEYRSKINDIKEKLLHESAHFFNIGRSQETNSTATVFARRVQDVINNDMLLCEVTKDSSEAGYEFAPLKERNLGERKRFEVIAISDEVSSRGWGNKVGDTYLANECLKGHECRIDTTYEPSLLYLINRPTGIAKADVAPALRDWDDLKLAFETPVEYRDDYYWGLPSLIGERINLTRPASSWQVYQYPYMPQSGEKMDSPFFDFPDTRVSQEGTLNLVNHSLHEELQYYSNVRVEISLPRDIRDAKTIGKMSVSSEYVQSSHNSDKDICTGRYSWKQQECFTRGTPEVINQSADILCEAKFKVLEFSDLLPEVK